MGTLSLTKEARIYNGVDSSINDAWKTGPVNQWSCSVVSDSCNTMDCSLPDPSIHEIFQARVLEWVAISFSRGLPDLGIEPRSPALQADTLPSELPGKPTLMKVTYNHPVNWARSLQKQLQLALAAVAFWFLSIGNTPPVQLQPPRYHMPTDYFYLRLTSHVSKLQ